jgi:ABC-type dipeptide/oligopeptide/nickel transport system ATPase component
MELIEFIKLLKSHHVVGIVGELGDGKSILGVALINILYNISVRTDEPKKVLSNIPLNFNHEFLVYYDQLDDIRDSLLFVDEIHLIADSRMSHSDNNFFTSQITVAVRKRKNMMIWTSQETSQVELRVRNRTTLFLDTHQVGDLIFEVTLVSKNRRVLGTIRLSLRAWKDDYDTFYIPLPLIDRDEENSPPDNSDVEYIPTQKRKQKKQPSNKSLEVADKLNGDVFAPSVHVDKETGSDNLILYKTEKRKANI